MGQTVGLAVGLAVEQAKGITNLACYCRREELTGRESKMTGPAAPAGPVRGADSEFLLTTLGKQSFA